MIGIKGRNSVKFLKTKIIKTNMQSPFFVEGLDKLIYRVIFKIVRLRFFSQAKNIFIY